MTESIVRIFAPTLRYEAKTTPITFASLQDRVCMLCGRYEKVFQGKINFLLLVMKAIPTTLLIITKTILPLMLMRDFYQSIN